MTEYAVLREELGDLFRDPLTPLEEERFQDLALRIFALQYQGSEVYRAYCDGRGRSPGTVSRWEDVPRVPAEAFKHLDLYSGPGDPEAVFVTSGTSRGRELRGRHPILSLDLYRQAAVPWFVANLVPEGGRIQMLSMVPPPAQVPGSSLSAMMGFAHDACGAAGSGFFADAETGVDAEGLYRALQEARLAARPVLVMGTAFAWVQWLDRAEEEGWSASLPEGSRVMETGGFKGLSRSVERWELYGQVQVRLGVAAERVVSEYGMTELLSQLYEPILRAPASPRRHRSPPWLRVQALDAGTLEPVDAGETGVLAFYDLANLGSVSAVLTQDLGRVGGDGVELLGRAPGAEPRGCSLALEEILGRSA